MLMPFNQPAPTLGSQYDGDRVLRSYLRRKLPAEVLAAIEPELRALGDLAGGELYAFQLADRLNEPRLTQWDAWGERIDRIELSPLWERARALAAEAGVVAAAYEPAYGRFARIHQFALAYLFHPSTDVYTCPLAMTDGAARTLLRSGNRELIDLAVPRLTSRDPAAAWTSGQWMTESTGGSDVGRSETLARRDADGNWRLYGRKWFTSATTSEMALTLARPEGNEPGGRGLALFFVQTRDDEGRLRNIQVNRLKDKLGTRKVPTAELTLDGTPAILVGLGPEGARDGVSAIIPMLHLTRTWNSVMSASVMRRGLALARDYAGKRIAFGRPLADQPLHREALATAQAEFEAAFHLSFFLVELIGADEAGTIAPADRELLRLLTSLAKLTTGRQAVDVVSEAIEAFGGAGYVEDTGLPLLLRDAHVLPIWEGTTNVLALDALRALQKGDGWPQLAATARSLVAGLRDPGLLAAGAVASRAIERAAAFLGQSDAVEAGMRRWALTVGRALSLALLLDHAQWAIDAEGDPRPAAAARRFAQTPIDLLAGEFDPADAALLINDQ